MTAGALSNTPTGRKLGEPIVFQPNTVYWCGPTTIHEALPMTVDTYRQFMRISMPNDGAWHEGYTENPFGVKPTGPIHPARKEFMAYRG